MARPRNNEAPNLSKRINLTVGVIERLTCRTDQKAQAFLRDSEVPGLRVRVTNTGAKSFVFEAKLDRQTIRRTIGDVKTWTIDQARAEARRLAVTLDNGDDPREIDRQREAERAKQKAAAVTLATTAQEAWTTYIEERSPLWGEHHRNDHQRLSKAGGIAASRGTRGKGITQPGPLFDLLARPLRTLDSATIENWAKSEATTRPTTARLAWRLLRAFLAWCAEHPEFSTLVSERNPAKTKKAREALGKPGIKQDALLREQLPPWFEAIRGMSGAAPAAYLQTMLLTGARPGEIRSLQWRDLDAKWNSLTIRDKVEGERVIPLTPYVRTLLEALPRRNDFVFASGKVDGIPMSEPSNAHDKACAVAGIEGLTLHGLRRSFKSLTEWLDIPAGVVAQIMGHKPSATAEKHYTVRPLDLLRVHHERIESWILEQGKVPAPNPR